MGIFELILLGCALAADASAVSISNSLTYPRAEKKYFVAMPLFFGLAQGIMPLLGYFLTGLLGNFGSFIQDNAGIICFVILGFIGAMMIREGITLLKHPEEQASDAQASSMSYSMLFAQAIATAIDAFAVGVSLQAAQVSIAFAAAIIMIATAACCVLAILVGKKLGNALGDYARIAGGVILIFIAIKALF